MEKLKKLITSVLIAAQIGGAGMLMSNDAQAASSESEEDTRRNPPLVSGTRENSGEIRIEGDNAFVRRIEGAMAIIREHPDFYEMVNTYTSTIRPSILVPDRSYSNPSSGPGIPVIGIGRHCAEASLTWIAGQIVHEAYHSKLFHEHRPNSFTNPRPDTWGTGLSHMKVYEVQKDFLREAGAPRLYLDYLQDFTDNYWTMNTPLGRRGNPRPERFRLPIEEPEPIEQPNPMRHHNHFHPSDPRSPWIMPF